jgi:hypothetical protein
MPLLPGGEDTSLPTVGDTEEATVVAPVEEMPPPGSKALGKPSTNIGNPPDDEVRGGGQEKVTICHKGKKTLTVAEPAWAGHNRHGDQQGPCTTDAGGGGSEGQDKVTVCHKGRMPLTVAEPAWAGHNRHGDTLGAC